jgi:hypothetical protein
MYNQVTVETCSLSDEYSNILGFTGREAADTAEAYRDSWRRRHPNISAQQNGAASSSACRPAHFCFLVAALSPCQGREPRRKYMST